MGSVRQACAVALLLAVEVGHAGALSGQAARRTTHVVLAVSDGVRWQEVFTGADSLLLFGGSTRGDTALQREFWRAQPNERREVLLPFLWGNIAREGQLFGNRAKGSLAQVTNGRNFSYPGYNEMLTGYPDARIDRNDFGPNPNVTVFEWLNRDQALRGSVAAFGTWAVFLDIFNPKRSGITVRAGWNLPPDPAGTPERRMLERLYRTTTRLWQDNAFDALMQADLLEYLRDHTPHVLFVGYGETDEWAHAGRYDLVLRSARQFDVLLAELWRTLQAQPAYAGRTTLIVTTDHGRGGGDSAWRSHGADVAGAENVWLAVLGPDTPALGERGAGAIITQSQIAATIAALLGKDYANAEKRAAPPIDGVMGRR